MTRPYALMRPLLFRLAPERAHRLAIGAFAIAGRRTPPGDDAILAQHLPSLGLSFRNPLGIAAGFDKDAEVPAPLFGLGFGFVEVGTLTPRPQAGNPRPRIFRLTEDRAIINRLGFNNGGQEAAARRIAGLGHRHGPLGINIGANRDSDDRIGDYGRGVARLADLADYFAINVSSPNTPGLRNLQDRDALERLLGHVLGSREKCARRPPVFLKIAPDLDDRDIDDIAAVALASGIEGMIVSNTTLARPATLRAPARHEAGGLSGAPLMAPSTALLGKIHARTRGRLVLVGVGGIGSGADAYEKIRAGASLVQLYTALIYEGPGLVARIKKDLATLLRRDGFASVADAVGADQR